MAASDEPASDLSERNAHEPASALAHAAPERDHRAERHQIAGQVVDRRHGIELRPRRGAGEQLTLAARDAADRLHHRVEATARCPRPDVTERAQRDDDDARPQFRERLGREPAVAEGAGTVALREHVALADQPAQRLDVSLLAQIEMRGELDVETLRRSEEHTSELQSPCNLVCRLLLEKKKKIQYTDV